MMVLAANRQTASTAFRSLVLSVETASGLPSCPVFGVHLSNWAEGKMTSRQTSTTSTTRPPFPPWARKAEPEPALGLSPAGLRLWMGIVVGLPTRVLP